MSHHKNKSFLTISLSIMRTLALTFFVISAAAGSATGSATSLDLVNGHLEPIQKARSPASIFEQDSRVFADNGNVPFRWVGRLFVNDRPICSAFLIGPQMVMTAGHCVLDDVTNQPSTQNFSFQSDLGKSDPAYTDGVRFPQPKNPVLRFAVASGYTGHNANDPTFNCAYREEDIAILWLQFPYASDFGYFKMLSSFPYYRPAMSIGYPSVYESEYRLVDSQCKVRGRSRDSILTDCAVDRGNSGGPLVIPMPSGEFMVVGVASSSSKNPVDGEIYFGLPYEDSIANRYTQIPIYRNRIDAALRTLPKSKDFFNRF